MDRRAFIGTLASGLLAAPLAVEAQSARTVPRIGVIGEQTSTDPFLAAFRQGLRELGYTEGQNILIEYRYAHGVIARFPKLVAELIGLRVDLLVVGGTAAAQSAKAVTTTVPIVFVLPGDPVGSGLVASLARPGGNATGTSSVLTELTRKHLELLQAVVPRLSRVAVLYNPGGAGGRLALNEAREAGRAMTVELEVLEVRRPNELASALSALRARRTGALLAISDPVFGDVLAQLARLAIQDRLPAIYVTRGFAEAGGLIAYGPSFPDNYRRAASYVDKIIKGAKPADLPVEQPTKFDLVINLKTAKALGVTIPPSLLERADQVIE